MPSRVVVDDDEQIIADLQKAMRRLRARLATTTVYGTHDEFTVAATPETEYQLTYIPVSGTCAMYVNGLEQEENTDYTVDYDTTSATVGLVTFVTALVTGDRIDFRYPITDWLAARSLPEETDSIADTFNRGDSTTTINPASDGGTWTVDSGTWGISSNRGVLVATTAGQLWGGQCAIRRDLGSAAADLSVDVAHTAALNYVLMMLGVDPATGRAFWADLHQGIFPGDVDVRLVRVDAYGASVPLASTTIADWTGTKTFRVTHDGSGGLEVFADGVSILTASDPTWVVSLGTWVALSGQTTDSFDNFSASVV